MSDPVTITGLMALYGAVLSSIGLGWNLYRDLQDKPRLKISMGIRRIVPSPDGKVYSVQPDLPIEGASQKLFLVADVTNVGRRPVKWMGWGGKYHKRGPAGDSFIIQPIALPTMLKEGESCSEFTDDLKAASTNVRMLFVYDASGKNWYLSRSALKKLKQECVRFRRSSRGLKAIRRQEGKPDGLTSFPHTASPVDVVRCYEADGYKVIGHEIIDTPEDEEFRSTVIVTVQPALL